jgi:hypothetical protein
VEVREERRRRRRRRTPDIVEVLRWSREATRREWQWRVWDLEILIWTAHVFVSFYPRI